MKKQETLKEVAKRLSSTTDEFNQFVAGAKWQEHRIYSESDMYKAFGFGQVNNNTSDFKEFIKQLKNK